MHKAQPIFDPATRYRIELQGRVDVDWLQSFEASTQISVTEAGQTEAITVLTVQADQSRSPVPRPRSPLSPPPCIPQISPTHHAICTTIRS